VTVLDVIQRSTQFLEKKAVESPRLQAELLLAHLLKLPRMQLYLNFERVLTEPELSAFRELVRRRSNREPLQYIVGSISFCGLEIAVNPHVLIPRPETELLAELAWTFLDQSSRSDGSNNSARTAALDFGTGSGCLAIVLAVKCPDVRIDALDISSEALAVARANANKHGVTERVQFIQGESLSILPKEAAFDLITSNPPYIPTKEIETLQAEVRDFEPHAALDGGPDGLDYFRQLATEAHFCLRQGGKLMLEFGDGQSEDIRKIFEAEKWIVETIRKDYNQRPRIITVLPNK
jgi:release factor glutamine methyltransferase